MRALLIAAALVACTGCAGNMTAEQVLEAVKIRDDQCGTAVISGSMEVGGTMGFFGSSVAVHIDKSKRTYTDAAGALQDCP